MFVMSCHVLFVLILITFLFCAIVGVLLGYNLWSSVFSTMFYFRVHNFAWQMGVTVNTKV